MAVNKSKFSKLFVVSKRKPQTDLLSPNDDDDDAYDDHDHDDSRKRWRVPLLVKASLLLNYLIETEYSFISFALESHNSSREKIFSNK